MATKNHPGAYDCYANADPDEPLFVLLARDPTAEYLVAAWVALRCGDVAGAVKMMLLADEEMRLEVGDGRKKFLERTDAKAVEASGCSQMMRTWRLGKLMDEIEERLKNREAKP